MAAPTFTLTSADVHGQATPEQYYHSGGCTGHNTSPHLRWDHPPAGTQSFAVTMFDPDAPTGSGFWHWVVFNLPADARELPTGAGSGGPGLPPGAVQSRTDYGIQGYGGPCPPQGHGPHAYHLTVYALRVPHLDLGPDTPAARVAFQLNAHVIQKAGLVMYGQR